MTEIKGEVAPLTSSERMGELDVLRGFALLAVFVVHFVGATYFDLPYDEAIEERWAADPIQSGTVFLSDWLFHGKGNTLFATLFGMGFWVMMERLRARGTNFERIYLRRLFALYLIGLAHLFLLFPMDVLHEYALVGLVLFLLRGLSPRAMLAMGLPLALFGEVIGDAAVDWIVTSERAASQWREVYVAGSYSKWLGWFPGWHLYLELERGGLLGWALYILGRLLLGAWIIRMGWLQRSRELLPRIRRILMAALPIGLLLELVAVLVWNELIPAPEWIADAIHTIGAPVLALAYACSLILLFHSSGKRAALALAPVGRIALTAYVAHGAIWLWLNFPLGAGLAGVVAPLAWMGFAFVLFAAMALFGSWWLARFAYGPLEYLWRWATYGNRPTFALGRNEAKFRR